MAEAEGVISKDVLFQGYCYMKFAAIREGTLDWNHPVLKDASSGDIIDFYGSCEPRSFGKGRDSVPEGSAPP